MQFSFWEKEQYNTTDATIIIGSGIVGMSTAISIKEKSPNTNIIIVERQWPPQGASTKNAGFVCFGSYSEIVSDLKIMTTEECINLIKMRWDGIKILQSRLSKGSITNTGGYELFDKGCCPSESDIIKINSIFEQAIGQKNYLRKENNNHFPSLDGSLISMSAEGMLNPMDMVSQLYQKCISLGINHLIGLEIDRIDTEKNVLSTTNGESVPFAKCVVCTNGFALKLLPNIPIVAVRNQVMMTKSLPNLKWKGVYHYDEGYYYFRNYGDRILLGGARNYDPIMETTDRFGSNKKIKDHLTDFMSQNVIPNMDYTIETEWSGILGMGPSKTPIIERLNDNLFVGVRLGGMGVAIGSYLGDKLSKLILS